MNQDSKSNKYYLSQVAQHTDKENGYWMVIDNHVYDLTKFMSKHPGGTVILEMHLGLDASEEFKKVGHDLDSRVLKMMKKYEIGEFIRPKFDNEDNQKNYLKWSKTLSLCTEMLNAFKEDIAIREKDLIPDVYSEEKVSPLNVRLMSDLLVRFKREYILTLIKKVNECLMDGSLKKETRLITDKIQKELQIHDENTDTNETKIEYQETVFHNLIKCQTFLQELKNELINMNQIWEKYFRENSFNDLQSKLIIEQNLISILKSI